MPAATHSHQDGGLNLDPTITAEVAMEMLASVRVREVQLEAAIRQLMQQNEQAANTQLSLLERIRELEGQLVPSELSAAADEVVEGDVYELSKEA